MEEKSTQKQIVTQSQLERGLEFLKVQGIEFGLKELIGVTAVLEDYVAHGWNKELNGRVVALDKWLKEQRNNQMVLNDINNSNHLL